MNSFKPFQPFQGLKPVVRSISMLDDTSSSYSFERREELTLKQESSVMGEFLVLLIDALRQFRVQSGSSISVTNSTTVVRNNICSIINNYRSAVSAQMPVQLRMMIDSVNSTFSSGDEISTEQLDALISGLTQKLEKYSTSSTQLHSATVNDVKNSFFNSDNTNISRVTAELKKKSAITNAELFYRENTAVASLEQLRLFSEMTQRQRDLALSEKSTQTTLALHSFERSRREFLSLVSTERQEALHRTDRTISAHETSSETTLREKSAFSGEIKSSFRESVILNREAGLISFSERAVRELLQNNSFITELEKQSLFQTEYFRQGSAEAAAPSRLFHRAEILRQRSKNAEPERIIRNYESTSTVEHDVVQHVQAGEISAFSQGGFTISQGASGQLNGAVSGTVAEEIRRASVKTLRDYLLFGERAGATAKREEQSESAANPSLSETQNNTESRIASVAAEVRSESRFAEQFGELSRSFFTEKLLRLSQPVSAEITRTLTAERRSVDIRGRRELLAFGEMVLRENSFSQSDSLFRQEQPISRESVLRELHKLWRSEAFSVSERELDNETERVKSDYFNREQILLRSSEKAVERLTDSVRLFSEKQSRAESSYMQLAGRVFRTAERFLQAASAEELPQAERETLRGEPLAQNSGSTFSAEFHNEVWLSETEKSGSGQTSDKTSGERAENAGSSQERRKNAARQRNVSREARRGAVRNDGTAGTYFSDILKQHIDISSFQSLSEERTVPETKAAPTVEARPAEQFSERSWFSQEKSRLLLEKSLVLQQSSAFSEKTIARRIFAAAPELFYTQKEAANSAEFFSERLTEREQRLLERLSQAERTHTREATQNSASVFSQQETVFADGSLSRLVSRIVNRNIPSNTQREIFRYSTAAQLRKATEKLMAAFLPVVKNAVTSKETALFSREIAVGADSVETLHNLLRSGSAAYLENKQSKNQTLNLSVTYAPEATAYPANTLRRDVFSRELQSAAGNRELLSELFYTGQHAGVTPQPVYPFAKPEGIPLMTRTERDVLREILTNNTKRSSLRSRSTSSSEQLIFDNRTLDREYSWQNELRESAERKVESELNRLRERTVETEHLPNTQNLRSDHPAVLTEISVKGAGAGAETVVQLINHSEGFMKAAAPAGNRLVRHFSESLLRAVSELPLVREYREESNLRSQTSSSELVLREHSINDFTIAENSRELSERLLSRAAETTTEKLRERILRLISSPSTAEQSKSLLLAAPGSDKITTGSVSLYINPAQTLIHSNNLSDFTDIRSLYTLLSEKAVTQYGGSLFTGGSEVQQNAPVTVRNRLSAFSEFLENMAYYSPVSVGQEQSVFQQNFTDADPRSEAVGTNKRTKNTRELVILNNHINELIKNTAVSSIIERTNNTANTAPARLRRERSAETQLMTGGNKSDSVLSEDGTLILAINKAAEKPAEPRQEDGKSETETQPSEPAVHTEQYYTNVSSSEANTFETSNIISTEKTLRNYVTNVVSDYFTDADVMNYSGVELLCDRVMERLESRLKTESRIIGR